MIAVIAARRRAVDDYAILVLLSRLGLRCGEVAALELGDVDWRAGELVIRGKGSRIDRLPPPGDVGEALVDYLRHGRPRGFGRPVFVTACAPLTAVSRSTINDLMVRACKRAGIAPVGDHRLRHTVASELLSHGAGLVGDWPGAASPGPRHDGDLCQMRREALCCIPGAAGRNLKGCSWIKWLTQIRKVKTAACQESASHAQVSEVRCRETRVIWRKLDRLKPNLQKMQRSVRRKDTRYRRHAL